MQAKANPKETKAWFKGLLRYPVRKPIQPILQLLGPSWGPSR